MVALRDDVPNQLPAVDPTGSTSTTHRYARFETPPGYGVEESGVGRALSVLLFQSHSDATLPHTLPF